MEEGKEKEIQGGKRRRGLIKEEGDLVDQSKGKGNLIIIRICGVSWEVLQGLWLVSWTRVLFDDDVVFSLRIGSVSDDDDDGDDERRGKPKDHLEGGPGSLGIQQRR